jgi:hypothetical protein
MRLVSCASLYAFTLMCTILFGIADAHNVFQLSAWSRQQSKEMMMLFVILLSAPSATVKHTPPPSADRISVTWRSAAALGCFAEVKCVLCRTLRRSMLPLWIILSAPYCS